MPDILTTTINDVEGQYVNDLTVLLDTFSTEDSATYLQRGDMQGSYSIKHEGFTVGEIFVSPDGEIRRIKLFNTLRNPYELGATKAVTDKFLGSKIIFV